MKLLKPFGKMKKCIVDLWKSFLFFLLFTYFYILLTGVVFALRYGAICVYFAATYGVQKYYNTAIQIHTFP